MLSDLNTVRKLATFAVIVTVAIAMSMGEVINQDGITYVYTAQATNRSVFALAYRVIL
jgi:ribonucleotide reductase beta subunit family protein with ferritin-like domain